MDRTVKLTWEGKEPKKEECLEKNTVLVTKDEHWT